MTATIIGLAEFQKDMRALSAAARKETMLTAIEAGAEVIQVHAGENARQQLNRHPMGQLTGSIGVRRVGNVVEVGVFGIIYAKIHEFGGVITPRHGPFLVFEIDGKLIRTKKVTIPARPYLRPAVDKNMAAIRSAITDAIVALLKKAI